MTHYTCDKCKKEKDCKITIFNTQLCESCMLVWNQHLKHLKESYQNQLKELFNSFMNPKVVIETTNEDICL